MTETTKFPAETTAILLVLQALMAEIGDEAAARVEASVRSTTLETRSAMGDEFADGYREMEKAFDAIFRHAPRAKRA